MLLNNHTLSLGLQYATTVNPNDDDVSQSGHVSDDNWWEDWITLSSEAPVTPLVPAEAQPIHALLDAVQWEEARRNYPNQSLAQFFLNSNSIQEGFRIGYKYGS